MRDSTYKFTLDVHDVASQVQIVAKQNDNARKIIANLMENGKPYALDIECRAVFMCKKPDGNVLYNDCDVINKGSAISYDFTNQTTAVTGIHECEIRIYGADDEIITSPRFTILVTPNVYQDGQVTSASEFNALTDIVSDVAAGLATINQAVSDVNDGLDDINDALDREQDILDTADTVLTNATTYATNAQTSATNASVSATAAATSETNASTYATNASNSALVSEGYATGTQNGVAVGSTSPYYQNNSKYYKEAVENMDIHVDWTKVDNKPTEYTPSAHNHNDLYYGKSDVYQKTETYSKTEVDGMIPTSMDWRNITNTPADYPPSSHNHNDLYYSKTEIDGKKATRDTIGFIKPDNTTTFVDSDGVLSAVGGGGAGSAIWGSISGDITNQTDLSTALSGKANTSHTHTKSEITDFSHTHTKSEITDFAHNHDSDYYKKSETYTQTEIDGMVPGVGTLTDAGILKPDGTTITVDADGTIHGASTYTLPEATASDLGGVKIGSGVNVAADGTISVDAYTLPTASTSTLGGVKIGDGVNVSADGTISVNADVTSQELTDLKVLGWTVPSDCPVQNEVNSSGQFVQKVGRVDLGSLTWGSAMAASGFTFFYARLNNSKIVEDFGGYCKSYTKVNNVSIGNLSNGEYKLTKYDSTLTCGGIFLRDDTYTNATTLKTALSGVYLYYELATPITLPIDGNEATVEINNGLSDFGLNNIFDGLLTQGYIDSSTGNILSDSHSVSSNTKYSCNGGDKITVKATKKSYAITIGFFSSSGFISRNSLGDTKEYTIVAPSNATTFRISVGHNDGITPETVGHIGVYVNSIEPKWELIGSVTGANSVAVDASKYDEIMVIQKYGSIAYTYSIPTIWTISQGFYNGYFDGTNKGAASIWYNAETNTFGNSTSISNGSSVIANTTMYVYGKR